MYLHEYVMQVAVILFAWLLWSLCCATSLGRWRQKKNHTKLLNTYDHVAKRTLNFTGLTPATLPHR